MSFYIKKIEDLNDRIADVIVFDNDNLKETIKDVVPENNNKERPFESFKNHRGTLFVNANIFLGFAYALCDLLVSKKVSRIELVIEEKHQNLFKNLLENIHDCLLENDVNIGLLVFDRNIIDSNEELLEKYDVFICSDRRPVYRVELPKQKVSHKEIVHFDLITPEISFKSKCDIKYSKAIPCFEIASTPKLDEDFKTKLIKYMNKSKKTNVEIYTRGGITRKVFSKIISNNDYFPKKETIMCLVIGMELCLDDALDLLNAAGYTLSSSLIKDSIVKDHIEKKKYDIDSINAILDNFGETPLGWKPREN